MTGMKHAAAMGLAWAMAVACAPPVTQVRNYQATYACENGKTVHVRFSTGAAVLESDGGSVAMNQERTADGFLYAGGGQRLRGRGMDATWTDRAGKAHACHDAAGAVTESKSALKNTR